MLISQTSFCAGKAVVASRNVGWFLRLCHFVVGKINAQV